MNNLEKVKNPLILKEDIIPDLIGKPFNNPFEIFIFHKKDKLLKIQKYEQDIINKNNLNDYGISSTYCNGNNHLFISGGEKSNLEIVKNFWKINLQTQEIDSCDMPTSKKNHSMIFIPGNYVFIVGGNDLKTFYYNIHSNEFISWADLNNKRTEPALALISNYLYCFDNININNNNNISFEKTDVTSEYAEWEIINPNINISLDNKQLSQKYFGLIKYDDNNIIFIGGNMDGGGDENENKFNYKYNINMNTVEFSEIPFKEYNLKEKTFLTYNQNVDYILPDFNRHQPEVIFFQKNKNKLNLVKYHSNKENKFQNPHKPLIEYKYNLNMPSIFSPNHENKENKYNKENANLKINAINLDIKEPSYPELNINSDINNKIIQNPQFEPPKLDPTNPDPKMSINITNYIKDFKEENNIDNEKCNIDNENNEDKKLTNNNNNIYSNEEIINTEQENFQNPDTDINNNINNNINNKFNEINNNNKFDLFDKNKYSSIYSPEINKKYNIINIKPLETNINALEKDINTDDKKDNLRGKNINLSPKMPGINFKHHNNNISIGNNNVKENPLNNNKVKKTNINNNSPKKEDLKFLDLKKDIFLSGTIPGIKTPNKNMNINNIIDFKKDINICGVIPGKKKSGKRTNPNDNININNPNIKKNYNLTNKNNNYYNYYYNTTNNNYKYPYHPYKYKNNINMGVKGYRMNYLNRSVSPQLGISNKNINPNINKNFQYISNNNIQKKPFAFYTSIPVDNYNSKYKSSSKIYNRSDNKYDTNKPRNDIIKNIPPLKFENVKGEFGSNNIHINHPNLNQQRYFQGNLINLEYNNLYYNRSVPNYNLPKQNTKSSPSNNHLKKRNPNYCFSGIIPGVKKDNINYNKINIQTNDINVINNQIKNVENNNKIQINVNNKVGIKNGINVNCDNTGMNIISEDNNTKNILAKSEISMKKKGKGLPLVGQKNNNFQPSKIENIGNLDVNNVNVNVNDFKYNNEG